MVQTLLKRLLQIILTTVAVMAVVIFLVQFLPDYASFEGELRPTTLHGSVVSHGFWPSFQGFWKNIFLSDFGNSRTSPNVTVGSILRRDGLITFYLFICSLIVTTAVSFLLGFASAFFRNTGFSKLTVVLGLYFTSAPSFLIVPILIYIFSINWNWLPVALWEGPKSIILPTLALSLRPTFFLARIFTLQLVQTSLGEFVVTAKAKGLAPFYIWRHHILPASLTTFIVGVGNLFGQFIAGTFLVETLFALPGLGSLFVRSLAERDYPVFFSLIFISTIVLQFGHRISDMVLGKIGETKFVEQEWMG